jgi:uncharacterized membrane protein
MTLSGSQKIGLALVVIAIAGSAALYPSLPERIPSHWNVRGEIDGWMPKPLGAFFLPGLLLGTWLLFLALPKISPKNFEVEKFGRAYDAVALATIAFLFVVSGVVLMTARGLPVAMDRVMFVSMGALFIVIGNVMGKVTRNFFVGIRTPWTLASEEVWLRTHRFGGKVFVVAGLAVMVCGLAGAPVQLTIALLVASALVPVAYSYVVYRKVEKEGTL